jgi:hypothetical protein
VCVILCIFTVEFTHTLYDPGGRWSLVLIGEAGLAISLYGHLTT